MRLALASHSSVETSSVANVRKSVGGRPPVSSSAGYLFVGVNGGEVRGREGERERGREGEMARDGEGWRWLVGVRNEIYHEHDGGTQKQWGSPQKQRDRAMERIRRLETLTEDRGRRQMQRGRVAEMQRKQETTTGDKRRHTKSQRRRHTGKQPTSHTKPRHYTRHGKYSPAYNPYVSHRRSTDEICSAANPSFSDSVAPGKNRFFFGAVSPPSPPPSPPAHSSADRTRSAPPPHHAAPSV